MKSGFVRLTGMDYNTNVLRELSNSGRSIDSSRGVILRDMDGGTIYPKLNRYMRNNMIMSLENEAFKRRVMRDPLLSNALAIFGVFDIDDATLRKYLS